MKSIKYIVFVLLLFVGGVSVAQTQVEDASQAYREQDYKKSIELYKQIIAQELSENRESADIYYNLGNAYFRDGQLGEAILNYERALLLAPGDSDIRHNLRFARTRTEDKIEIAGNLFLTNWINGIQNIFSSNQWARTGIVFFIVFLACVAVFLFVRQMWAKKTAFYAGLVLLVLLLVSNIFAFNQKKSLINRDTAIVMTGAASVKASPDANSNELFQLHEGTKVKIRSTDGNWYEIEIANGSVGWTPKENVEVI